RVRIGRGLGGGDDHVIGHEDRGVSKGVGLARELDQDVGDGERAATRKGETEFHGGGILRAAPGPGKATGTSVRRRTCHGPERPAVRNSSKFASAPDSSLASIGRV